MFQALWSPATKEEKSKIQTERLYFSLKPSELNHLTIQKMHNTSSVMGK